MNRRDVLVLSGALAAAALAGCTGGGRTPAASESPSDARNQPATGSPTETSTGESPAGTPEVDEERLSELAAGNAAFALDLHRHLADETGGNQFLSPYSVSTALAMTFAGARGETREEMANTLRYTLGEEVHPAFADLEAALAARETTEDPVDEETVDAFRLESANALWGDDGHPFAEDFRSRVAEYYGAGLRRADFAGDPDGERERINDWVADNTGDRVEELLPPGSIDPSTVLVLANAVYFAASWRFEFDPEDTEDGTFAALDGAESTVPLMRRNLRTNYASVEGARAVELPYVGGDVSMVLILPDEGEFEAFERALDADRLFGIFEELGDARGDVVLPRFEFESSVQLSEALADLGMPSAFGPAADFSGMVEGDGGLRVDDVFHEAFVSVDEEGTEAAAATAVSMVVSVPPDWGELRFDRPFLFCIRDRPTDAVLFLGRVVDAGAAQGG